MRVSHDLGLSTRVDVLFRTRLRTTAEYRYSDIAKSLARLGIQISAAELRERPEADFERLADAGRDGHERRARMIEAVTRLTGAAPARFGADFEGKLAEVAQPRPPREYTYTEVAAALDTMGIKVTGTHIKNLRTKDGISPGARLLQGLAAFFGIPVAMLQAPVSEAERQQISEFFTKLTDQHPTDSTSALVAARFEALLDMSRNPHGDRHSYADIADRISKEFDISITGDVVRALHEGTLKDPPNTVQLEGIARFFGVPPTYLDSRDEHHVAVINQQLTLVAELRAERQRGKTPIFLRALADEFSLDPATAAEIRDKMAKALDVAPRSDGNTAP